MAEIYAIGPLLADKQQNKLLLKQLNADLKVVAPKASAIDFPYVDHYHPLKMILGYHKEPIRKQLCAGPGKFQVEASYGYSSDRKTVYIDLGTILGPQTIPRLARTPLNTSSRGVGELLKKVVGAETEKVVFVNPENIATDLGMGMFSELGVTFFDQRGLPFEVSGGKLGQIASFSFEHFDRRWQKLQYWLLDNQTEKTTLTGEQSISQQHCELTGASPELVKFLEQETKKFTQQVDELLQKQLANQPQAALGNGFAFGCLAFFRQVIVKDQIAAFAEITDFETRLKQADYFVTLDRYGPFRELLAQHQLPTLVLQTTKDPPKSSPNELILPFQLAETEFEQLEKGMQALVGLLYFRKTN